LEALKKQLTLNKQEEGQSNLTSTNLSVAAKHCHIDADNIQIKSDIAQHLEDKSDFNFVNMHFLNHFSNHIRQLHNLLDVCSELPAQAMMDASTQGYQQLNRYKVTFQILQMQSQK